MADGKRRELKEEHCEREFDVILFRRCNAVYNQNTIDRWTKGCIFPFSKKGDLRIAKKYRGIILTSIAAMVYNALIRNCMEPKIEKILMKNQDGFQRNRSTTSQILTIRRILEGIRAIILEAIMLFIYFSKVFDSIQRGKMEQILLVYGFPMKDTLYKLLRTHPSKPNPCYIVWNEQHVA